MQCKWNDEAWPPSLNRLNRQLRLGSDSASTHGAAVAARLRLAIMIAVMIAVMMGSPSRMHLCSACKSPTGAPGPS